MHKSQKHLSRTIWVGIGLVIVLVCIAFVFSKLEPVDRRPPLEKLPVMGTVSEFTLTNQFGDAVTLADLRGQVWIADIIFTRCAGPCPRMTRQMKQLQDTLPADSGARLVTLTTDPVFDTPEVLLEYAKRHDADPHRWQFLTGTALQIGNLAIDSLKLSAIENPPEKRERPEDLFVHSTIFVLVDQQARLRGVFHTGGEMVEWTNVQPAILQAVQQLESEP